jgi:hypothetical protein
VDLTEIHELRDRIIKAKEESGYNGLITTGLFYELNRITNSSATPFFTVKEYDIDTPKGKMYSAKRLFVEFGEPTGYQFAINVLGSYSTFRALEQGRHTKKLVAEWIEELEVKLHSEQIQHLRALSEGEGNTAYQAAKLLVTQEYKEKDKKGRPKKEDIAKAAKKELDLTNDIGDDFKRLGLPWQQ